MAAAPSAQPVVVRKVENAADSKAFFELPWKVYRNDPNWVPQLLSMRRELLDKHHNPAWEYMEGDYFIAQRGDQVVGTIAAFVNHRHDEFHNEKIGWFGAFDVFNDHEAAAQLLETAEHWVKARGINTVRGPQTFTTHEDVGLLIDGFERPVVLMPYHPPYYRALIEQQGYTEKLDTFSFYFDWDMLKAADLEPRFERITNRIQQRGTVNLRPIDRKNLRRDFELFKEIYNKAWVDNWGFVPMTEKELNALIEGLSMIFDPDLAVFAEINGQVVGFLIVVPDFNQVLHAAYPQPGTPEIFTLIKAGWHWKVRPVITATRVPLMGVLGEHRTKGIDMLMYYHVMKELRRKGFKSVDCGWILESNHDMIGIMRGFGMKQYRTYRLYEKILG